MVLILFTLAVTGLVVMAFINEDLLTAFGMSVNVFLAGLLAFSVWEPVATVLESQLETTFLHDYEDALSLMAIFCISLGLLRLGLNRITGTHIEYPLGLLRAGTACCGLVTGYLASGFLICMLQTIPWHENFMYFQPTYSGSSVGLRRYLPPDRMWLALMHRAGQCSLSSSESGPFDPTGSFELRYGRHRRYGDKRNPLPYHGEFSPALAGKAD